MEMDKKGLTHTILDPRTFEGSFNIWLHVDHLASTMFKHKIVTLKMAQRSELHHLGDFAKASDGGEGP